MKIKKNKIILIMKKMNKNLLFGIFTYYLIKFYLKLFIKII